MDLAVVGCSSTGFHEDPADTLSEVIALESLAPSCGTPVTIQMGYDAGMRITWVCVRILSAALILSTGCQGSKGRTSAPIGTGGQGGRPVTQGTEGGSTVVEGSGGTIAFTAVGGATAITGSPAGGGGMTGTGTSASGLGGIMSVGGVPAGPPVAAADFVDAWATAICDALEPCCKASQYGWSRSGCEAEPRDLLKERDNYLALEGVIWDAQAAGKCIAGIKRDFAGCHPPINIDLFEACRTVMVGSKAPGETCTNSIQCAAPVNGQGECVSEATDGGTGVRHFCKGQPSKYARGRLGDSCMGNCTYVDMYSVSCSGVVVPKFDAGTAEAPLAFISCFDNDGLYCDEKTFKCTAQVPLGGACNQNIECANGLFCKSGKCATPLSLGETCVSASSAGLCETGLYCDRSQFVCKQGLPDGANCGSSHESCQSGICACNPSQTSCVCTPRTRRGQVSETQCTGIFTYPKFDAGAP